jgi:hypothetical protein
MGRQQQNQFLFALSIPDAGYIAELRQGLIDAGFEVPLFQCNPP